MSKGILDKLTSHCQLSGPWASGLSFGLSVIIMILVLCLPGCGEVYVTSPLGPPAVIDKEKFEGLWLMPGSNNLVATAHFDENRQIQVNAVMWTEREFRFGESQVIVTEGAKYNYLSIRTKGENGWENKYHLAQYTFCGDHLVIRILDPHVIKKIIDAHVLSGFKNNRGQGYVIYITTPPEKLVQFLNEASDQYPESYYLGPIVFRKFRGVEEKENDISTERCPSNIQYSIGVAYDKDEYDGDELYVSKDEKESVLWYRRAAEQGYAPAQYQLARAYYYGSVIPRNDAEAVKWLRLSQDQGYEDAKAGLAWVLATSPDEMVRDGAEAVQLAEAYFNARNVYGEITETDSYLILAAAYAESGRFDNAVAYQKKALAMMKDDDTDIYKYRLRLWSYLRQEPWRDNERQQN